MLYLEDLAEDETYEFAFITSPLKIRGATASPIRPNGVPYTELIPLNEEQNWQYEQ